MSIILRPKTSKNPSASSGDLSIASKVAWEKFKKLGVETAEDLVMFFPNRYEDETSVQKIKDAPTGLFLQVEVEVVEVKVEYRPRRQLVVYVKDSTDSAVFRYFNFYPSQQRSFEPGSLVRAVGEFRDNLFRLKEMIHPRVRRVTKNTPLPEKLTPIYPTTKGLTQPTIRTAIERALKKIELVDTLSLQVRASLGLDEISQSIRVLHQPPKNSDQSKLATREHPAWVRIKFDELLAQQLLMRVNYDRRKQYKAIALNEEKKLTQTFLQALAFNLTRAQEEVLSHIRADLAQSIPMRRLLQGDVGSGKTVVAALAALQTIGAGHQVAMMVPTEILSEQHFKKIADWFLPLGINVLRLTGSMSRSERKLILDKLLVEEKLIIVGTHALFQDDVIFKSLGLTIIDEQHRFGVRQRLKLVEKGENVLEQTHQLMMSATPIPRTLAMSFYGDLDVSVIDELPPGRTPVLTKLVNNSRKAEVLHRVRDACSVGQQVYWVCPLIEESETLQLETAIATFERVQHDFPMLKVGLVHGRLKATEKAEVMSRFQRGEIDLLVATTVIEVGVDVPNATVMIIENAERMGLSQLHQLRGRVGRGAKSSTCILMYDQKLTVLAKERLKIIFEHTDGFKVAQLDLKMRGPGEVLGAKQSGVPMLRYVDLEEDEALLSSARAAAEDMIANDKKSAMRHIARWYGNRKKLVMV
ncbi:MAG: ATP-dependent DNA helicase RecG [Betaproteobacteria bacterium]